MNKEHNNLTIENLLNTDLFNNDQKYEIEEGLQGNLNVYLYAHPCFNAKQMY